MENAHITQQQVIDFLQEKYIDGQVESGVEPCIKQTVYFLRLMEEHKSYEEIVARHTNKMECIREIYDLLGGYKVGGGNLIEAKRLVDHFWKNK